jgi:hypothetical protein
MQYDQRAVSRFISARMTWRSLPAILLLFLTWACSKGDTATPMATVTFTSARQRITQGSPVEFTYRFDVAPDAKFSGDYRVFVHINNADGETLWSDDHDPEPATSQWRPGQRVQYTRTVFAPVTTSQGEATVVVGLYREGAARLPLQGPDPADRESTSREYRVGTLQLASGSENLFVIYKSGWHPAEFAPEDPRKEWQWTQKSAALTMRNPRQDVNFYLQYDGRPDLFAPKLQQVSIFAGSQLVDTFAAESATPVLRKIAVPAAALGGNEMAEIRIELDQTFVPAKLPAGGKDNRELGIRIYYAFIEPR